MFPFQFFQLLYFQLNVSQFLGFSSLVLTIYLSVFCRNSLSFFVISHQNQTLCFFLKLSQNWLSDFLAQKVATLNIYFLWHHLPVYFFYSFTLVFLLVISGFQRVQEIVLLFQTYQQSTSRGYVRIIIIIPHLVIFFFNL